MLPRVEWRSTMSGPMSDRVEAPNASSEVGGQTAPLDSRSASAAVAVILIGASPQVALIRRADRPNDPWSGHMALPGGHKDPVDADLTATALRETREETGIDLSLAHRLGSLPLTPTLAAGPRGVSVAPFLFWLPNAPEISLNEEVAELVWVALGDLETNRYASHHEHLHDNQRFRFPAWNIDGRVVWGLTFRILQLVLDAMYRPRPGMDPLIVPASPF